MVSFIVGGTFRKNWYCPVLEGKYNMKLIFFVSVLFIFSFKKFISQGNISKI